METTTTSKKYSLNLQDFGKALIIAMLTPALVIIQQSLDAGTLAFNFKAMGMASVGGGIAYLLKNFFTPAQTIVKNDEPQP